MRSCANCCGASATRVGLATLVAKTVEIATQGGFLGKADQHRSMFAVKHEHAGGGNRRRVPIAHRGDEVLDGRCAAVRDHGDVDRVRYGADERDVVALASPLRSTEVTRISPAPASIIRLA